PGGLGGRVTALAVHIETYPTHIAGLPVAVCLNCHAARHKTWDDAPGTVPGAFL
ncbi:MAG: fumarate hydratase, partial [Syntrophaceticus schinkii]|nr:fumarate hydratase [Syntrophaceticus schinkii]